MPGIDCDRSLVCTWTALSSPKSGFARDAISARHPQNRCFPAAVRLETSLMAQPPWSTSRHAPDDSWYAELEQLAQRYEHGEISDDQFTKEKQRILQQSRHGRSKPAQLQIVAAVY